MRNKLPAPILITGCARSGTSMVAGVINMCGAFGGNMSGPNHNNQRGMFENSRIRQSIVKPYLRILGVDAMGQYPLPNPQCLSIPSDLSQQVENVMLDEGYQQGPWMYKGAKMCLTWPIWHYAFPNAKWIIVRRKTEDIITSCLKTNFMRAFNNKAIQLKVGVNNERAGWEWWVQQHEKRFVEMIEAGLNVKMIWPDHMVTGDYSRLYETLEWIGLEWRVNKILSFIDPKLWHSRNKEKQLWQEPRLQK